MKSIKKIVLVLLALSMILCVTACKSQGVKDNTNLTILYEQDDSMINTYTLIAVNPDAPFVDANGSSVSGVKVNTTGADALMNWMLSEEGEKAAAEFGKEDFGDALFYNLEGAPVSKAEIPEATKDTKTIRLSTTTSVNDSGLLAYLLPKFEEKYGYKVEIYSEGTGKSIANAMMGNADLILVHAKDPEEAFVSAGYARKIDGMESERCSFLYNYFVLVGPKDDPVKVKECKTVKDAFAKIASEKALFISRGDGSGTHTKELSLWPAELGITADATSFANYTDWYNSANAGMAACLKMANEKNGYILSDKATYLTFNANKGEVE